MTLQSLVLYMCLSTNQIGGPMDCEGINVAWVPLDKPTLGLALAFNRTDRAILISQRFKDLEVPTHYLPAIIMHELAHLKGHANGTNDNHGPNFIALCKRMSDEVKLETQACSAEVTIRIPTP